MEEHLLFLRCVFKHVWKRTLGSKIHSYIVPYDVCIHGCNSTSVHQSGRTGFASDLTTGRHVMEAEGGRTWQRSVVNVCACTWVLPLRHLGCSSRLIIFENQICKNTVHNMLRKAVLQVSLRRVYIYFAWCALSVLSTCPHTSRVLVESIRFLKRMLLWHEYAEWFGTLSHRRERRRQPPISRKTQIALSIQIWGRIISVCDWFCSKIFIVKFNLEHICSVYRRHTGVPMFCFPPKRQLCYKITTLQKTTH